MRKWSLWIFPFLNLLMYVKNFLTYFWLCWVLVVLHGLFVVTISKGYSSLWCTGFFLPWRLLLWSTSSRHMGSRNCSTWASEIAAHGLSSWVTGAQLLCSLWNLPGSVIKPVCAALADGFLNTAPPENSRHFLKIVKMKIIAQQEKSFSRKGC